MNRSTSHPLVYLAIAVVTCNMLVAGGCAKGPPPTPLELANKAFWEGRYDRVVAAAEQNIDSDLRDAATWDAAKRNEQGEWTLVGGRALVQLEQYPLAITWLDQAHLLCPDNAEPCYQLAMAYKGLGDEVNEQLWELEARKRDPRFQRAELIFDSVATDEAVNPLPTGDEEEPDETENEGDQRRESFPRDRDGVDRQSLAGDDRDGSPAEEWFEQEDDRDKRQKNRLRSSEDEEPPIVRRRRARGLAGPGDTTLPPLDDVPSPGEEDEQQGRGPNTGPTFPGPITSIPNRSIDQLPDWSDPNRFGEGEFGDRSPWGESPWSPDGQSYDRRYDSFSSASPWELTDPVGRTRPASQPFAPAGGSGLQVGPAPASTIPPPLAAHPYVPSVTSLRKYESDMGASQPSLSGGTGFTPSVSVDTSRFPVPRRQRTDDSSPTGDGGFSFGANGHGLSGFGSGTYPYQPQSPYYSPYNGQGAFYPTHQVAPTGSGSGFGRLPTSPAPNRPESSDQAPTRDPSPDRFEFFPL